MEQKTTLYNKLSICPLEFIGHPNSHPTQFYWANKCSPNFWFVSRQPLLPATHQTKCPTSLHLRPLLAQRQSLPRLRLVPLHPVGSSQADSVAASMTFVGSLCQSPINNIAPSSLPPRRRPSPLLSVASTQAPFPLAPRRLHTTPLVAWLGVVFPPMPLILSSCLYDISLSTPLL